MTLSSRHDMTMIQAPFLLALVTDCSVIVLIEFLFTVASALLRKESNFSDWVVVLPSSTIPHYVNVGKTILLYIALAAFVSRSPLIFAIDRVERMPFCSTCQLRLRSICSWRFLLSPYHL